MSIAQNVVIHRTRLPSTDGVAAKAREWGFDLKIDPVDLGTHSGFLPCTLGGKQAGFEWSLDNDVSICEELGISIDDRDCVCVLVTHSDETECQSALVCAASILALTNGVYFDDYDNVDQTPDRILAEVRDWINGDND